MESHAPPRREGLPSAAPANKQSDAAQRGQLSPPGVGEPHVLWLTGRPGSGKTTLARAIHAQLTQLGRRAYVLDGDELRGGLCSDLDFSDAGRLENIRRASEVAKVLVDAGVTVIASFVSPLKIHRDLARSKFKNNNFFEIYCSASLEVCERRDPKGHYAAARRGEIKNFTGVDGVYEEPRAPELIVDTEETTIKCGVQSVLSLVNFCDLTTKRLNKPP